MSGCRDENAIDGGSSSNDIGDVDEGSHCRCQQIAWRSCRFTLYVPFAVITSLNQARQRKA